MIVYVQFSSVGAGMVWGGVLHFILGSNLGGVGPVRGLWGVCVFYYCRTYYKAVRVGGGGEWRTCAMRDDEPRPVWMCLLITH